MATTGHGRPSGAITAIWSSKIEPLITTPRAGLAAGAAAFCLVAILNCGGYRYGVGDHAFYVPALVQHLDPTLFPRDRHLLHAQDRFMLYDNAFAWLSRTAQMSIPSLFLSAYVVSTLLLFGAVIAIGRSLFVSWWTIAALAALLTLRHRITQTGANTLEAYFQPRMMAFALGACAIAAYLRGKGGVAISIVIAAFAVHPTTALWFAIWIAVALAVSDRRWRIPMAVLATCALGAATWAVLYGPLSGHLVRMDPLWASALAGKDYIFPSDWGGAFWLVNFTYLPVAAMVYGLRRTRGVATNREPGLLIGAAALVCVFLVSWPLMTWGLALALQLQTSRIFWMLDFLTTIYIAWVFAETAKSPALRRAVAVALVVAAIARGVFVWRVEHSGEPLVRIAFPQDSWTDAMRWISKTPAGTHVLADPGHAWKYGTSVRVSGERDVYLEEVKDLALALYSRDVAIEALARIRDAHNFTSLDPQQLRQLAARYHLDYLVVERNVDLPVAYRNDRFRIYELRSQHLTSP